MQRFILSKKNQITLINATLIVIAFVSKLGFKRERLELCVNGYNHQ
jgi:Cd2+/Zn2+-exporting ATPase